MHRLLKRQIKKFLPEGEIDKLAPFLHVINEAYQSFEEDLEQMERTLEMSSQELMRANLELKKIVVLTTEEAQSVANQLQEVVDNVTEVIFQTDKLGHWTFLNPAWEAITGHDVKRSIGTMSLDYFHGEDQEIAKPLFAALVRQKIEFVRKTIRLKVKNGGWCYVDISARVYKDEEGDIVGTSGTIMDITEKKEQQEQLKKSESNLEAIVRSLDDIVFEINDQYLIKNIWIAQDLETSFNKDRIVGRELMQVFDQNAHELLIEAIDEVLISEGIKKFEYFSKRDQKWFLTKVSWLKNSTKIERKVSVLLQDITKKKSDDKELQDATARYVLGVESARFGFWDWDLQTNDLVWDANMYEIFEVDSSKPDTLLDLFRSSIHPEDVDQLFEEVRVAIQEESESDHLFRIITKDKKLKYLKGASKVHYNDLGQPISVTGLNWDITKTKETEINLIAAKEEAERASQSKAQFLSIMSHEIRTPMNAVIGISNLLLENNPREDQLENLKTLKFSSNNLLVLINDILDFSKMDSGKVQFEELDFDLKHLMNGIKKAMLLRTKEKGIDFEVNIQGDFSKKIIGDPTRLSQVLNNLLGNSVKFTNKGSVRVDISIEEKKGNEVKLLFVVSDTGIGIPKDKMETIFESFSQASSSTTREYGGTGLGLAITKKIIELRQGEILVESEEGKGSKFQFRLPFKLSESTVYDTSDITDQPEETFKGVKILLVDDNPINILVAKQFLQKWELEIDEATNGKEAFDLIRLNVYSLVLMDLQMPEMDGYETTIQVRKLPNRGENELPIIALTANAFLEVKEKVLQVGMNDYISKPFNPTDLHAKIKKYVMK